MMIVVDHVRPWLTPSSTLANTTQPQRRRPHQQQGDRDADDPAGDQDWFAAVAVRQGAGEEVGAGLDDPEGGDERERGGELGEAELLLGEQRQDGALLADHAADEGVDADEQRELGEVLAQAEAQRRRCRGGRCAHRTDHQWLAGRRGPRVGSAVEDGDVAVPAVGEDAGAGHGALAVPAHHRHRAGGDGAVGEAAELDVDRARDVAGFVLVALADIDHRATASGWRDERDPGDRAACGAPGVDAAVELADDAWSSRSRCRGTGGRSRHDPDRRRRRSRSAGRGRRSSRASWRTPGAARWRSNPAM